MKNRNNKERQIWRSVGESITLSSCSAHGHPTPEIAWMKDGVILNTDSDTLEITDSATVEDSGVYECWANNTHGEEYMPYHVNITSGLTAKIVLSQSCMHVRRGSFNVQNNTNIGHIRQRRCKAVSFTCYFY